MKTKEEIYKNTQDLVLRQNNENYMEYLRTYKKALDSGIDINQVNEIKKSAYEEYQRKENELYDILDHAYLDYMHDTNPMA